MSDWRRVSFLVIAAAQRVVLDYKVKRRQAANILIVEDDGQDLVTEAETLKILKDRKTTAFSLTSTTLESPSADDSKLPIIEVRRRGWHWEFRGRNMTLDTDPKLLYAAFVLASGEIPASAPASAPTP